MVDTVMTPDAFGQLLSQTRPRLHRYCARMLGSAFDGEDVVQDAMAKAIEALPDAGHLDNPERWLFRIAHNTALDALRRRKRQAERHSAVELTSIEDPSADAAAYVDSAGSFAAFLALPPTQRACVVLSDVLGYANAETADILETTVAAVKADVHRGREKLKAQKNEPASRPALSEAEKARLYNYASLFNARDFDALRDLLAEDVRLDLVNRTKLSGRRDVSVYFTRYAAAPPWRFTLGFAEGQPALLVSAPDSGDLRYVVLLGWAGDKVASIRDFLYAPYIVDGLATEAL
ncbi:MAG: sigma-70 family RNA polymerase sigma factor [Proteobacteria bacterium]|nr:sigma-70 family RNA polymerase sigma factor [Pseudomonadota bacterium]